MPVTRSKVPRRATYEDANLLLRLYELRHEERFSKAREWFIKNFHASTKEEFQKLCPAQLGENAHGSQPLDMAASFVAGGVLHAALFTQNSRELLLVWERIHDIRTGVAQDLQERKQLRTRWSRIGFQILRLGFNGRRSSRRHTNTGLNAPGG